MRTWNISPKTRATDTVTKIAETRQADNPLGLPVSLIDVARKQRIEGRWTISINSRNARIQQFGRGTIAAPRHCSPSIERMCRPARNISIVVARPSPRGIKASCAKTAILRCPRTGHIKMPAQSLAHMIHRVLPLDPATGLAR